MSLSSVSLRSAAFSPLPSELDDRGLATARLSSSFRFNERVNSVGKRLLSPARKWELRCCKDKDMDVSASAVVDGVAECSHEIEVKEPGISTLLMNFENKFDPYGAISTPIYQTATFKQPSATENGPYDYTRSGNPTRDALESLLAKLDKADRAFCFTSGMAALAAVTRLVSNGEEIVAGDDLYGGSDRLLSQVTPKSGVVVKSVSFLLLISSGTIFPSLFTK